VDGTKKLNDTEEEKESHLKMRRRLNTFTYGEGTSKKGEKPKRKYGEKASFFQKEGNERVRDKKKKGVGAAIGGYQA